MTVVSDTSTITNLLQVGQLGLLRKLYGQVIIPTAVMVELEAIEGQAEILRQANWIVARTASNRVLVNQLLQDLDVGESEAIALALEMKADYLVIDEQQGRKIALDYGLPIVGLLGVLAAAKDAGHIQTVKPVITAVVENGFHLHKKLVKAVLRRLNE